MQLPAKDPAAFVPEGHALFEKVSGDLNKDGLQDLVLIIKGTDSSKIINHEYRGRLDRNRRGLLVLFNKNDGYETAAKNYECFSSENEEGGVYYAPELSVEVKNSNLIIHYGHGRYGYWSYTLKYKDADFELIGYDATSSTGPVINSETSINFLTRKMQVKKNTNENAESGGEVFKETWKTISIKALIKLSDIKDFDELDMHSW
ncbi:MAG: hypothetical protein EOP47_19960 [Sphingobacteriaceae bacterium]|nr:MAG: hypothetical protein EOP47_19960 [Sphingobacteriaceae bacterium]